MAALRATSADVLPLKGVGMKHVVIVGGGFAGVKAARELMKDRRFTVTLISDRLDFEYHAALYRSATGRSPLEVSVPLTNIFYGTDVEVVHDTATKIDAKKQILTCTSGSKYQYDELILALGAVTAYFGIKGLPDYSYTIKTVTDALRLKDHLHAELTAGHKPDLNYVVVGAGPAGVELAAEMVSYLKRLRKRHGIKKHFHVDLVEAAPRILPSLPEQFSRVVEKRLKELGIKLYTSTAVKGETADQLQLPEGSINTHTVIWTAGLTNDPFYADYPKLFSLGKGGKVEVDEHLSAGNHIWVLGDSALTAKTGWAQTAVYDGIYIGKVLKAQESGKPLPKYNPGQPIGAIPAGHNWCGVNMSGRMFYGYLGWIVRRWADFRLYRQILPLNMAVSTWLMGNSREESCPECR
jgi:NADH:ubiquinone reductase (H+-translocating)